MSSIDWIVLLGTLGFIAAYGAWKTRKSENLEGYLKGGNDMKWTTIGLSVMATQASAITFISTPGQAYESGDRKSTRLNSSHVKNSYAVFCLKKKIKSKCSYAYSIL